MSPRMQVDLNILRALAPPELTLSELRRKLRSMGAPAAEHFVNDRLVLLQNDGLVAESDGRWRLTDTGIEAVPPRG